MTPTRLLIPAVAVGPGRVAVTDLRTGVAFQLPADGTVRHRGAVYVPADSLGSDNGLHLARFRGGEVAWVRDGEAVGGGGRCEGCAV